MQRGQRKQHDSVDNYRFWRKSRCLVTSNDNESLHRRFSRNQNGFS